MGSTVETIDVPSHTTSRMTVGEWVFTFARTGCLRVQKRDFTAYLPVEAIDELVDFLKWYRP